MSTKLLYRGKGFTVALKGKAPSSYLLSIARLIREERPKTVLEKCGYHMGASQVHKELDGILNPVVGSLKLNAYALSLLQKKEREERDENAKSKNYRVAPDNPSHLEKSYVNSFVGGTQAITHSEEDVNDYESLQRQSEFALDNTTKN